MSVFPQVALSRNSLNTMVSLHDKTTASMRERVAKSLARVTSGILYSVFSRGGKHIIYIRVGTHTTRDEEKVRNMAARFRECRYQTREIAR